MTDPFAFENLRNLLSLSRTFERWCILEISVEVPESPRNRRSFRDTTVNVRNKHIFSWVWHTFTLSLSHMIGFVRFRRSSAFLDHKIFTFSRSRVWSRVFQLTKHDQILAVIDKTYLSEPKTSLNRFKELHLIFYMIYYMKSYIILKTLNV